MTTLQMLDTVTRRVRHTDNRRVPETSCAQFMLPYDVRLKRELSHRRLVISMARKLMRVVSLHLLDAALLAGALVVVGYIWPAASPLDFFAPVLVAIFLLCLNAVSAYDSGDARRDRRRLFSGVMLALLIVACLVVLPPHIPLSATLLVALGAISFFVLAAGRKVADQIVRQAYVHGIGLRRAVVIGDLDEVGNAIQELRDDRNIDQYIVGHLTPAAAPDAAALGVVADLPRILDEQNVQEVLVASALPAPTFRQLTECCFERGIPLFVMPSVICTADCRSEPLRVGACTLLHLHPARLELPALLVKRCFDLVGTLVLLIVLAPLMLLLGIAIRMDSPGPVFFKQRRVGLGGRVFTMWKFRSMFVTAEQQRSHLAMFNPYGNDCLFKLRGDPRITRVGRFLRRSSLDELPQLFNVIRGDMSLVGPRPPLPREVAAYEPHHFDRLSVVPGLTGPWQVSGRNLITDFERVVQLERTYIRSWSLLLDAKILLRTVKVVISGEGAY